MCECVLKCASVCIPLVIIMADACCCLKLNTYMNIYTRIYAYIQQLHYENSAHLSTSLYWFLYM